MFERFWKSGVPSVEKNRAVPPVGQDVVGTREVVAEGLRRVRPEEDAAGVADQRQELQRLAHEQLEVLGRDGVGDLHPLLQVADDHDQALPAQRGARDVGARQRVDLPLDLDARPVGELLRIGDQHAGRQLVVLGLREQVGGDVARVGGVVREDQDLARSGDHVDVDLAEHHLLRGRHVDVARAHDLVHPRDRRRAVGHRPDGLGAADAVDLLEAEHVGDHEHVRVEHALRRRRADGERADTGDLRRDRVHQHRARVGRLAAGDVEPDPPDRRHELAEQRAVVGGLEPGLGALTLVKGPDARRRLLEERQDLARDLAVGLLHLLAAHGELAPA